MENGIMDFFVRENSAWDDMIAQRKSEIPVLEAMLKSVMEDGTGMEEHALSSICHLANEMKIQDRNLCAVSQELEGQKEFLSQMKGSDEKDLVIYSLSRQNIIREHIRKAERDFIEWKCNLLNYVSTLLQFPHQISKSF